MLFHGVAKLSNLDGIKGMVTAMGGLEVMAYGVYITEIIAPILILIGYRTRIASIIFFFGMIAALLMPHSENIFALSKSGGLEIELILLYAFGALVLFFSGSGKFAVSTKNIWD